MRTNSSTTAACPPDAASVRGVPPVAPGSTASSSTRRRASSPAAPPTFPVTNGAKSAASGPEPCAANTLAHSLSGWHADTCGGGGEARSGWHARGGRAGVSPSPAARWGSAPAASSSEIESAKPLTAAMNSAVHPAPFGASTSAPSTQISRESTSTRFVCAASTVRGLPVSPSSRALRLALEASIRATRAASPSGKRG